MERISTSPRYVIDTIGPDPLSLGELGGCNSVIEKNKKCDICNFGTSDRILMKFDI